VLMVSLGLIVISLLYNSPLGVGESEFCDR
jgi:hypothetical protein